MHFESISHHSSTVRASCTRLSIDSKFYEGIEKQQATDNYANYYNDTFEYTSFDMMLYTLVITNL